MTGTSLTPLHDTLWILDRPLVVGGLHLGARTTIARLEDGTLWIHSPGPTLTSEVIARVRALGDVSWLVAPNLLHHNFMADWAAAFAHARIAIAPGLAQTLQKSRRKHRDSAWLPRSVELGPQEPAFTGVDRHLVAGAPKLAETAFFHRASRTLVVTDLMFYVRTSDSWLTRLFMRLNGAYGRLGPSRIMRRMYIADPRALATSIRAMAEWPFDRILVAHGEPVTENAREAFADAWRFLPG